MTTYTLFIPGSGSGATVGTPGAGTTGMPSVYVRRPYLVEAIADFSVQNAVTNDIFNMFNVPAGSILLAAGAEVITAATTGTAPQVSLGFTGTAANFVSAQAITAAGHLTSIGDGTVAAIPKYSKGAANLVIMTTVNITGTLSDGKVRVWALLQDVSTVKTVTT